MSSINRNVFITAGFAILSSCTSQYQTDQKARTLAAVEACRASECERLNLDYGRLINYRIVADLTHVSALMVSSSDFDTLADIANMTQLFELHIGATDVNHLSGLAQFPNLTLLHANHLKNVEDFSAVGQLTGLTELAIGSNDLGDMAFLRDLQNVKNLSMVRAEITDLSVLKNMNSLKTLDLSYASVPDDISVLLDVPNLTTLTWQYEFLSEEHKAVLESLKAQGVSVTSEQIIIMC